MPAVRNARPILASMPTASASVATSPPVFAQTSAIALMNDTLVARNALAAPLTSSAVTGSVVSSGMPASVSGR